MMRLKLTLLAGLLVFACGCNDGRWARGIKGLASAGAPARAASASDDSSDGSDQDPDPASLVDIADEPSAADLDARMKNDTPIAQLSPYASGPGVVVCTPVVSAAAQSSFAFGVGGWLNLNVAGCPEFGKSPAIGNVQRAGAEMHKPALDLTVNEAAKLSSMLGATKVAVGTLTDLRAGCLLKYQIYSIPNCKPIGAPISVEGTLDQIAAGLPKVAASMIKELAGSSTAPTSTGLNAEELAYLGGIDKAQTYDVLNDVDQKKAAALSTKSDYAAMVDMHIGRNQNYHQLLLDSAWLMANVPENALAVSSISWDAAGAMIPYQSTLAADIAKYPHNYQFAMASVYTARALGDPKAERKGAEAVVRCCPRSPDAWLTLGKTIEDEASSVREGRYFGKMSPAVQAYVSALYPDWVYCTKTSTELDPNFGKAWLRLSAAAAFNNDPVADPAFWKAYKLDDDKADVYAWGLELYQSKWLDDKASLAKVAKLASTQTYPTAGNVTAMADNLDDAEFSDLKAKLVNAEIAKFKADAGVNPSNGQAHWALATLYRYNDDASTAATEYQNAEQLMPWNAALHAAIGDFYDDSHGSKAEQAVAEYRQALAIDPDNACQYDIGFDLKHLGQFPEAEKMLKSDIALRPRKWDPHFALGEAYDMQKKNDAAIPEYETAVSITPWYQDQYIYLVNLLDDSKRYDEALKYAKMDLTFNPNDGAVAVTASDVYLNQKKWAQSEALSRYAIGLDANDGVAHLNLGDALVQEGKRDEAKSEWQVAMQHPNNFTVADVQKRLDKYQ